MVGDGGKAGKSLLILSRSGPAPVSAVGGGCCTVVGVMADSERSSRVPPGYRPSTTLPAVPMPADLVDVTVVFVPSDVFRHRGFANGELVKPLATRWAQAHGMLAEGETSGDLIPYLDVHQLLFETYVRVVAPQVNPAVPVQCTHTTHNPVRAAVFDEFGIPAVAAERAVDAVLPEAHDLCVAGQPEIPTLVPDTVAVPASVVWELISELFPPVPHEFIVIAERIWWESAAIHLVSHGAPSSQDGMRLEVLHVAEQVCQLSAEGQLMFFSLLLELGPARALSAAQLLLASQVQP